MPKHRVKDYCSTGYSHCAKASPHGVLTTKGEMHFYGAEINSDHLHQVSQVGITSRGTIITAQPAISCLLILCPVTVLAKNI